MIKRRGWFHRQMIVLASAPGSVVDLATGLWSSRSHRRWLLPLAVFLCTTGLLLVLIGSVEALAPFIYAIF
jgi:hypothetical protein